MDFEEFRERLMEDLKDSLHDRTGKEYTADANHVKKLQNADYDGIVIKNVEECEKALLEGAK